MIGLNNKIREHDFMTDVYLGECKNVYWQKFVEDELARDAFKKQMINLVENSKKLSKKPIVLTRHPFTEESIKFQYEVTSRGIELRNGY